jgi:general secretion pathway protein I
MTSSSESKKWSARRAFSLLEVLVALAILALVVVVLGASYLNVLIGYETVSRGMTIDEDVAFARQLVLREPDRKKIEQGGEFETAGGRRAKWGAEIAAGTLPDVFEVAFTCEISELGRPEPDRVVQRFTVLRPTWSIDAAEQGKLKAEVKRRIAELQLELRKPQ